MNDTNQIKKINQDILSRLQNVETSMKKIEKELKNTTGLNSFIENKHITRQDKIWGCEKCGSRLGIYDKEKDELRVRYRDFFAWWKPGIDGYLKIVCRGCSHINEVRYTDNGDNI